MAANVNEDDDLDPILRPKATSLLTEAELCRRTRIIPDFLMKLQEANLVRGFTRSKSRNPHRSREFYLHPGAEDEVRRIQVELRNGKTIEELKRELGWFHYGVEFQFIDEVRADGVISKTTEDPEAQARLRELLRQLHHRRLLEARRWRCVLATRGRLVFQVNGAEGMAETEILIRDLHRVIGNHSLADAVRFVEIQRNIERLRDDPVFEYDGSEDSEESKAVIKEVVSELSRLHQEADCLLN